MSNIIQLNEEAIKNQLGTLVRNTVEETLNDLLDKEADRLTNAARYERTEARKDTRAGYYKRKLLTKAGKVELKMPKLRQIPFETAIIERYKRRESSIEEALIEMYLAGVSVRRVEDITEVLWGSKVSPGTISNMNKKVYGHIETWRNRPLTGQYPYVYVDGIYLKRSWGGEYTNISVLVAIGVDQDGYREILGASDNGIERIMREIRRRTRVVGSFPDGNSALMLVCARLRYVASSNWGTKRYLNMRLLIPDQEVTTAV